ncbi:hypothetical protein Plhal304r1_c047g0128301 [Plasmopara halstedii]
MWLLPVRSCFSFLREDHPQSIYCICEEYSAKETERHLFVEYALRIYIWPVVLCDWSSLTSCLDIDPHLLTRGRYARVPSDLHRIRRAIVLRCGLTVCYDCLFNTARRLRCCRR